jgi:hypothetical protein
MKHIFTILCFALVSGVIAADNLAFDHRLTLAPAAAASDSGGSGGQEKGGGGGDLAKASQNPVADMISIPFQNQFNFGIGPNNVMGYIMEFEPVIPLHLSEDWHLITRTITPVINVPSPAPGVPSAFGLGDISPTLFLSPAKPGKFTWGLGPVLSFPTATDSLLGTGKWSAGPSAVGLVMPGHWVIGALVSQQWSFAGWGDNNVSSFLVEPFINYNLTNHWYLTTSPIITANWEASGDDRWTVPLGGGVGKIIKLGGKLPVNVQLAAYANVVKPDFGPDWQLRFQFSFLFPEGAKKKGK